MSDIKNSVLPDIIEPMSNAIHQNIPETARQMNILMRQSRLSSLD